MPKTDPVYLVDGSAYFYRAYHAITPLTTSNGLPTHAAYGFTNILLRVLREKQPRYLTVAYDARGPNFRHDLYPEYKANRPPMPEDLAVQIPYIKKIVAAYRIPVLEADGVEADDLIASAARTLAAGGTPVVVVSGDKDLLQLVDDEAVVFWDPMNDLYMDAGAVTEKYGVPPDRLLDLFALIGDKSDNIPGVPGIGPKTAQKLLTRHPTLDELYEHLDELGPTRQKIILADNREAAFLSRRLIRLRDDLEVPAAVNAYQLTAPDTEGLKTLFTELEFTRLLKSEIPTSGVDTAGFRLVADEEQIGKLVAELAGGPHLVIDTETSALSPLAAELVGISLCRDSDTAWYIPLGHKDKDGLPVAGQPDRRRVLDLLRPLLEDPDLPKIGHNLKFDCEVLTACAGIRPAGPLLDTMLASYLLDPSRRSHKLDDLGRELLDLQLTGFAEVTGKDRRPDAFVYVEPGQAKNYSCEDVYATLRLWELFRPRLEKLRLTELFETVECPLLSLLARMELTGIRVDRDRLQELASEFESKLIDLEREIHGLAGEVFNINSTRQLGEILFDRLKLPHGRRTKTGYSTDVKVLEKLAPRHELPRLVMNHRNITKLKTTYVDKLAGLINPHTGRLHTSFNQTVTATGRLSSSNPNLQNIPVRTGEGQRIRAAFVPAQGYLFLSGDYSQIDLRVLAHYSRDQALMDAFRAGEDIHNRTAAEIYMISPLLITREMRRVAKTINFGIVYGMSSFGLASQLNLSRAAAQTFIDRYFEHYTGVRRFMAEIIQQARRDGYVTTLLNRRRPLPEINSSNRNRREFAERTAINTPIQGTAADIIKLAMIETDRRLRETDLAARLLLQVHDELVFEVPEKEVEQTRDLVKEAMESVMALDVPLVVNMTAGGNLAAV